MNTFDHFLEQIGRYPLLTAEEEIELGRQVQAWIAIRDKPRLGKNQKRTCMLGKRAYERMFTANLRLVVYGAKKFINAPRHMTMDDLVQEGCFGLARSIEKFDPERGYKFSTYSYWWIRQSIMRAMEMQDRTIRLPVTAVQTLIRLKKFIAKYLSEHHRMPSQEECIEEAQITPNFYRDYMQHAAGCFSLDVNATTDESSDPLIMLLADGSPDLQVQIEENDLHQRLQAAIKKLEPEEYELLRVRYGLDGKQVVSRSDYGSKFGVSREAIRLREQAALDKLRAATDAARTF